MEQFEGRNKDCWIASLDMYCEELKEKGGLHPKSLKEIAGVFKAFPDLEEEFPALKNEVEKTTEGTEFFQGINKGAWIVVLDWACDSLRDSGELSKDSLEEIEEVLNALPDLKEEFPILVQEIEKKK